METPAVRPRSRACRAAPVILLWLLLPVPAMAVIRVDVSLEQIYKSSQKIVAAKVGSVDAGRKQARLRDAVTLEELGRKVLLPRVRTLALDLAGGGSLTERLHMGDPVLIFVGRRGGAIHTADAWFRASPGDGADWRIIEPYRIARTFPGTTPSLIRALLKVRSGQAPLLDAVMHHTWHGDFKLQTLDVKVKAMAAADADGDAKADLVVAGDQGVSFYKGSGPKSAFIKVAGMWGLTGATARQIAFADTNGDRRPDLLLDELYLNDGSRFVRSRAGINLRSQDILAVGLMDATADGRPDALTVAPDGAVTVYENPGKDAAWPRKIQRNLWSGGDAPLAAHVGDWGDDRAPHVMVIRRSGLTRYSLGGESADLKRLTGEEPMFRGKPRYSPMDDFQASAAWDRSGGDGNLDLHVATRRGKPFDLELVGRGHGAFFCNTEASTFVRYLDNGRWRGRQPRVTAMAPADMYGDGSFEMLVVEESGDLWQKDSPVYVRGKPIGEWGKQ
ncbi:MAG: FG-GAP-like repeat-containing protein [Phycisphaerae bacterium]